MSHYTMMVTGNTYEDVEKMLSPFYEVFEQEDPRTEFVDETEEARRLWEEGTTTRFQNKDTGDIADYSDERLYRPIKEGERPFDFQGYHHFGGVLMVFDLQDEWKETTVPYKSAYKDFDDFASDRYTWCESEEGYGYFRNPNAKWDWWSVGGRWTGTLKIKPGAQSQAVNGSPGLFTEKNEDPTRCDSILKSDIDIEFHRTWNSVNANEEWLAWQDPDRPEWPMGDNGNPKMFNAFYEWEKAKEVNFTFDDPSKVRALNEGISKEDYVEKFGQAQAITWGFLTEDGNWCEKGEMGWWGMSNYENAETFSEMFWAWFDSLDDDTRIWIVDCHI